MYQEAISRVRGSIFPVFFESRQGNLVHIGVLGTGFFVNDKGLFVTAYHVATNTPTGARLLYPGNVPNKPLRQPVDIEEVYSDAVKDVFVGRVSQESLPALSFAAEKPRPGKSVCLSGYPLARLSRKPDGTIDVGGVRIYWQPTFVIDGIAAQVDQREYQGFITQHTSLSGMSGGPVFDTEGLVYGMDVATFNRDILKRDGQKIPVSNGLVMGADTIQEILSDITCTEE